MLTRHRSASRALAERWWWLLPWDDIEQRLQKFEADLRDNPHLRHPHLIDETIDTFRSDLEQLEKECGHG